MSNQDPSIVLINRTHTNLSFDVTLQRSIACPSFRRRTAFHSLFIPAGSDLDLCEQLHIDKKTAQQIVDESPDIQRFMRKGILTWYERS